MEAEAVTPVQAPSTGKGPASAAAPATAGSTWRQRGDGVGHVTTTSSKGELQMADQFIRDNFTLFLWIPTEQVGIVIGKKGAKIQYIQGATKTRVIIAAQPDEEWESCWFQVMVKGPPSGCYQAFKMISGLVDEVDDCVAQFPIPRPKHSLVIGKSGTTIRTISADTNVRIYVPGKKDEAATNDIQLEGEVNNVMKALVAIMSSVYGNNVPRTPTAAQQAVKSEEDATDAPAEVEAAGEEEKASEGTDRQAAVEEAPTAVQKVGEEGPTAAPAMDSKPRAEAKNVEDLPVERTLVVTLTQLRLLVAGKKNSALTVVSKATGTKITKEPKPRPVKEEAAEPAVDGEDKPEGGVEEELTGAPVEAEEAAEDDKAPADDEEAGDAEDHGSVDEERDEEGPTSPGSAGTKGENEAGEAVSRPDPEIKVFIRGADDATVDAAAEAILAVANGKSVKELLPELRNRFGKSLPPVSNNNNGSNKGPGSKPKTFKHQGGRQGTGPQGRKFGGGRGSLQMAPRRVQLAPKST